MQLINCCWAFQPSNRPTFDNIKRMIERINPSRESPVDMMMIMVRQCDVRKGVRMPFGELWIKLWWDKYSEGWGQQ